MEDRMKWSITLLSFLLIVSVIGNGPARGQGVFSFTKDARNPILTGGVEGSWYKHLLAPCVIYNEDSSKYEMWFAACAGVTTPPARIGRATSRDGIDWSISTSPVLVPTPGGWDSFNLESPVVIRENGTYKMWYVGYASTNDDYHIGYATSPDGITWTKQGSTYILGPSGKGWDAGGAYVCSVLPVQGGYRMWYTGYDAGYDSSKIGTATSPDGAAWNRDTVNNPILSPGVAGTWDDRFLLAPIVLRIDDRYYMWYTGMRTNTGFWERAGMASSLDGVTGWTKDPQNPRMNPTPGAWDEKYCEVTSVVKVGRTIHLWYDGAALPAESNRFRIGHAMAVITGIDGSKSRELRENFSLLQNYPNPFNPSTTIRYALSLRSQVVLTVFNTLGQRIAVLENGMREAGSHAVRFDGRNLASGVYFYRLQAGTFSQTRKLLLSK
jgi:hypothetical protein